MPSQVSRDSRGGSQRSCCGGARTTANRVALRAGVSVLVPLLVLVLVGRVEWTPYAAFGAFTSLYGRNHARAERAGMQVVPTSVPIAAAVAASSVLVSLAIALVGRSGVATRGAFRSFSCPTSATPSTRPASAPTCSDSRLPRPDCARRARRGRRGRRAASRPGQGGAVAHVKEAAPGVGIAAARSAELDAGATAVGPPLPPSGILAW